jgi:alpha-ribazole phosphatase
VAVCLNAPAVLDARLREYGFGVLAGVVWQETESLYPDIWHRLHYRSTEWVPIPGEKGREAFHVRVGVQARHGEEETVAVVAHGGSLGMILVHVLGLDPRRRTPFHFGHASLSIVEFSSSGPRLTLMNDTCHLDLSRPIESCPRVRGRPPSFPSQGEEINSGNPVDPV